MTSTRSFHTRNDLPPEIRAKAIALLNQQLADSLDLHSQIKQAHWNVKGMSFIALHELFDTLAAGVLEQTDTLAERAVALGGYATGTSRMVAAASRLPEYPSDVIDGKQHVQALSDRFAAVGKTTRLAIEAAAGFGDADTADLFTGFSRELDKAMWFLEAHVQG